MKVLFLPEVVDQFLELAQILYDKGYLNSKDAAIEYSEKLFREIRTKLPLKVKDLAPTLFLTNRLQDDHLAGLAVEEEGGGGGSIV